MKKEINWGILGPGKIAGKFVSDLKNVEGARLWAVGSRSSDRARQFAETHQIPNAFGSYESLVQCPDLDVVYIASPHVMHCEHTLLCLKHKVGVLCEKPFGMNKEEVQQMVDLARQQNTFLMEAFWTRFLPVMLKVKGWIDEGAIGSLQSIKADFGFQAEFKPEGRLFNKGLGGGALLDIGIYPVFLSLFLLGKPDQIWASANLGTTGVDENCSAHFKYANGQMASLFTTINAQTNNEAYIIGDKGNIKISSRWHESKLAILRVRGEKEQRFEVDYNENGYYFEAQEVIRCLREQRLESDLFSWNQSLALIDTLDQVRHKAGINYEKP